MPQQNPQSTRLSQGTAIPAQARIHEKQGPYTQKQPHRRSRAVKTTLALLAPSFLAPWFLAPTAHADEWADIVTISSTQGLNANRLCIGASQGHPTDIGCPTTAPYVDPSTGNIGIGTTSPLAPLHVKGTGQMALFGDNSLLTDQYITVRGEAGLFAGISDRFFGSHGGAVIQSGTAKGLVFIVSSSTFADASPSMAITEAGNVGIGTLAPATVLDVSGTLRIANGGESCDTARAGAIRYASGSFDFCDGVNGWRNLADVAASGTTPIAIDDLTDAAKDTVAANLFLGTDYGHSLANNTYNTAVGIGALAGLTNTVSGSYNTAVGYKALNANTTGYYNTGIGYNALANNTTGYYNTGIGYDALTNNTTGSYNTAIGFYNIMSNISGVGNTGIGIDAIYSNTTGNYNTVNGYYSFVYNTTGNNNTVVGASSIVYGNADGVVAVGVGAAQGVSGSSAGISTSVFVGTYAGKNIVSGAKNTIVGDRAGQGLSTGSNNILVGANVDTPSGATSNYLNIGNAIYGDLANERIGIGTLTSASFSVSGTGYFSSYVGIGTDTPAAPLEVNGYISATGMFINGDGGLELQSTDNDGSYIDFKGYNNLNSDWVGRIAYYDESNGGGMTFYTASSTVPAMVIDSHSKVGIGITVPTKELDVSGTVNATVTRGYASAIYGKSMSTSGYGVTGYSPATTGFTYGVIGTSASENGTGIKGTASNNDTGATNYGVYGQTMSSGGYGVYCMSPNPSGCGGNQPWTNISDARLKRNVATLAPGLGLDAIMKLRPVSFIWRTNDSGKTDIGFIAQEVEPVLPALVRGAPDTQITTDAGTKKIITHVKSLSYAGFVVPLVKAVQQQQAEIEALRADNNSLHARIDRLEAGAK